MTAFPLGRRAALGLGGALLAAPLPAGAQAQPRPRTGTVVLPLPMPCASQPGDIVGLVLEGGGTPAGAVIVFGQVFRPGAVPRGAGLAARQAANGQALPAQIDVATRHPDGSARFGLVSLAMPALRAGARLPVMLAAAPAAAAVLDLAAGLAGRQAVLEVTPLAPGGEPWRVDLLDLLRADFAAGRARRWQAGALAAQARITRPVPAAAIGGATSARLVADIALRADGTLWVEPWIRNDAAMRPGGGPAAYALRLLLDGRVALQAEIAEHEQYAGWGRLVGAAPGGRAAVAPPPPRLDAAYLAATGAVANFDLSVGVDETLLARLAQAMATPEWEVPLGTRGVTPYMPMTGGRADIGPTTMAQAIWLLTGDPRAAAYIVGQAETAGAIPWHYWDPEGGADGRGGWMDTQRWPRFWLDGRNGPPPRSLLQRVASKRWTPDAAHQPDLSYIPFLLTGRRAFLDGLQAQVVANVLGIWPVMRTPNDVVVVARTQIRGAAWALRQVDEAAWISPEDDPNTPFMQRVAAGNWQWLLSQVPEWTSRQGEAHGWLDPGRYHAYAGGIAPWQQDFFASTVIASAARGNRDAMAYLGFAANWLVGRFLNDARGFNFRDGVAYAMAVVETPGDRWFTTWADIGRAQVERKISNLDGWSRGTPGYALATLAGLVSLDGPWSGEARRALDRLLAAGAPDTTVEALQQAPTYAVSPRGMPRVPGRWPACTRSAPAAAAG